MNRNLTAIECGQLSRVLREGANALQRKAGDLRSTTRTGDPLEREADKEAQEMIDLSEKGREYANLLDDGYDYKARVAVETSPYTLSAETSLRSITRRS